MTELEVPDEAIRTWAAIDPDEVDAADAVRAIVTPVVVAELKHLIDKAITANELSIADLFDRIAELEAGPR